MRLWLDTEFNGYKGELISIALVDKSGRSFYQALPCETPVPWVAEHVIPVILAEPTELPQLRASLQIWLQRYDEVHIIADWPEDIRYFCELLIVGPGKRIDTPRLTMEVRRDLNSDASAIPHNALCDANAIRVMDLGIA